MYVYMCVHVCLHVLAPVCVCTLNHESTIAVIIMFISDFIHPSYARSMQIYM